MTLGAVVVAVLAVAMLLSAGLVVRSHGSNPWPGIVLAMVTSGVCFTVGGDSHADSSGPSVATVAAAVVGVLSVVAAIFAMVPRSPEMAPSRVPILLSAGAIALGAVGLLVNLLAS
jgi:hypothetical protein